MLLLVVAYLVVVPLGAVIWGAVRGAPPLAPAQPGLAAFRAVLATPTTVVALRSTAVFVGLSTVVALALGGMLAVAAERAGATARAAIRALVLLPVLVPGTLSTTAWILLLERRVGVLNVALRSIGLPGPFDAATMPAMVWAEATDSLAVPFLLVTVALRGSDPVHLEAAAAAGASRLRRGLSITAPLLLPALLGAALITFVRTLGSFTVPGLMGLPGGIRVLTTEVYLATQGFPPRLEAAAAIATVQLAVVAGLVVWQRRVSGAADRFATIGGRRGERPRRSPRPVDALRTGAGVTMAAAASVVPLVVVLWTSLQPYYRAPGPGALDGLSLAAYREVLTSTLIRRAAMNTLTVGVVVGLTTMALGLATAWFALRSRGRGRALLDTVATLPVGVSGAVLAVALLSWYLLIPDVGVYGTRWIIVLGHVTLALPYGHRTAHAALTQLDPVLEEAAAVSGATTATRWRRVLLPLLAPGILVGLFLSSARTLKNVALPTMLAGPGTEMLPSVSYALVAGAKYPEASALGALMVLALAVLALAGRLVAPRVQRGDASTQDGVLMDTRGVA